MNHATRAIEKSASRCRPRVGRGRCVLALILGVGGSASISRALPIPVNNPSFEELPAAGLNYGCGPGCSYNVEVIPGWNNIPYLGLGLQSGQFRPGADAGNFTYFNTVSDGPVSAHTTTGCIWQTLPVTVQAGLTYTLQADVGWRKDAGPGGLVRIVVNNVFYNGAGTAVYGGWGSFTATYVARAQDVGLPIDICLSSVSNQGNFDNVRMSDSSTSSGVDEPAMTPGLQIGVHPNPFRAAATVRYSLAAGAPVTLRVFDLSGRPVRALLTAVEQSPGAHEVAWDGTDDAGGPVNSGLYFIRLDTGREVRVVRVLHTR